MADKKLCDKSAEESVASFNTGARNLTGWQANLIPYICLAWAVYQLYAASPLPSMLSSATGINFFYFIANLSISRKVHLLFALILVTLAYPLVKSSPKNRIPIYDWILILLGVSTILYMLIMNTNINERAGDFVHPLIRYDMTIAIIGLSVLALSVLRSLWLWLVIVTSALVVALVIIGGDNLGGYTDALFVKVMWHFWMQEEGVFGYWLSTSAQTLFLFVLFGAMLTSGGVGACFRKISFTQLGLLRSGPIKLIVVFVGISILAGLVYVLKTWVTGTFPGFTLPFVMLTMASVYLALRWVASKRPDLEGDDFGASLVKLPPAGVTAIACMSYLLPVVLLLWCILPAPYKLSAHLSAFYACIAMIVITLTQRPLKAIMRGTGELATECKIGVSDWVAGMIAGARNMIPITIAAAAAGVVIGAMTFFNRF